MNSNEPVGSSALLAVACESGYRTIGNPRLSAAAALAGAANRVVFTGVSSGYSVARFGAAAFSEVGSECVAMHAGDLTMSVGRLRPGDVLIGIDSDSPSVARALRRARHTGVHTACITTRDLTIVGADVLVPVSLTGANSDPGTIGIFACCLTVALLAAKLEPDTTLGSEVGDLEKSVRMVVQESQSLIPSLKQVLAGETRLYLAGQGSSAWVADSLGPLVLMRESVDHRLIIISVPESELDEGLWTLNPSDILIEIDPPEIPPGSDRRSGLPSPAARPPGTWSLGRRRNKSGNSISLPVSSPAMRSLVAYVGLILLLDQAAVEFQDEHRETHV